MSAGEIADCFDMAKPSVSHHLNVLKNAGFILDERKGQNIIYSLNTTIFQEIMKWFFDFGKGGNQNESKSDKETLQQSEITRRC